MRAGEMIADFLDRFLGGCAADFGMRTGAETFGYLQAHLDDALGARGRKRLRIRIGDDEVDALQSGVDHVVDGIAASAANAAHHDPGLKFPEFGRSEIHTHRPASFDVWVKP